MKHSAGPGGGRRRAGGPVRAPQQRLGPRTRDVPFPAPRHLRGRTRDPGPAVVATGGVSAAPADPGAGPLVRPYTMTGGRTRPAGCDLDMISIVVAARTRTDWRALEPEHADILRLCAAPMSVAEVSARLDLPLTVVKVLLCDLIGSGDVQTRAPAPVAELPEMNVLQAVLDGIRRL